MVKKKFLALTMAAVTVMSLFAGCTGKDDDPAKKKDGKFYLYSWNKEAGDRIKKLYEDKYGKEEADKIEPIIPGENKVYQEKIDPLLRDKNNDKYPDMIALEADYIKKYTDAKVTLPTEELGIKEDDCKDMYQYTVEIGKDKEGKLKALSWQACPGCMIYRRDLADKYLGVSEPEKVQEFFKDWAAVKETGKKIKEASNGECLLFQGYSELQRPYQNARKDAWVKDDTLKIDQVMTDYMKAAKEFSDEGICSSNKDDQQWNTNWAANMGTDKVFAYTSCTWFNQYTLEENLKNKPDTMGKWAMIQGPVGFSWGGTWLAATEGCSNKDMAGNILKLLQDTDSMKTIYTEFGDYPNNQAAVEALAAEEKEDSPLAKRFGGQKSLEFFKDKAKDIKVPEMCGEDQYANEKFNAQVENYISGKAKEDEAIEAFKKDMKDKYPNIK